MMGEQEHGKENAISPVGWMWLADIWIDKRLKIRTPTLYYYYYYYCYLLSPLSPLLPH